MIAASLILASAADSHPPDNLLSWFSSGYGVIFVAIISVSSNLLVTWLIEKVRGDNSKALETHKLNLKRVELLFNRKVSAATDFLLLVENILPSYRPGMDSYDAAELVALSLESAEADLRNFNLKHGVVITSEARDLLQDTISQVDEGKFDIILQELSENSPDVEPPQEAIDVAGLLIKNISIIEKLLIEDVLGNA